MIAALALLAAHDRAVAEAADEWERARHEWREEVCDSSASESASARFAAACDALDAAILARRAARG